MDRQGSRFKLLAGTLTVLSAFAVPAGAALAQPGPPPVTEVWRYERLVGDAVADEGDLVVPVDQQQMFAIPATSGDPLTFVVAGSKFDWTRPSGDLLKPEQLRYEAIMPSGGSVTAAQHEPGEQWRFTKGDFSVVEREAFDGKPKTITASSYVDGVLTLETMLSSAGGGWSVVQTGRGPDSILPNAAWAAPGAEDAEAPLDMKSYVWVEVPLPPGYGRFYGLAFKVGAEWVVKADGQEYRAISAVEDPTWAFDQNRID